MGGGEQGTRITGLPSGQSQSLLARLGDVALLGARRPVRVAGKQPEGFL